jgi:hypothetical protein
VEEGYATKKKDTEEQIAIALKQVEMRTRVVESPLIHRF